MRMNSKYSSSLLFLELCVSQEGTEIRFFRRLSPGMSFLSGKRHRGGTCSFSVAGASHM